MRVTAKNLQAAIERLDLAARPVCLHASLASFGHMAGGASTVVQAFLEANCTVLVPSFSWGFAVPPPAGERPARNGWNYAAFPGPQGGLHRIYEPGTDEIDVNMGAIPAAVVTHPRRIRGAHPLCSFSAVGPLAHPLVGNQRAGDVFAPLAALVQHQGVVLLIGVDLTKMTLLHLAEQQAGRVLFRRWANDGKGNPTPVDVGGCSDGFQKFDEVLAPLRRTETVGSSLWQAFPAARALDLATAAIRENPWITHCGARDCERCNDAVQGGPVLE